MRRSLAALIVAPLLVLALVTAPLRASDPKLAAGKLLVAARLLSDPNFSETVVLLLDYSETGAVGVVINDLLETRVSEVFPAIEELADLPDRAHYGGPVAMNHAIVLVRSADPLADGDLVFDDVWAAANGEELKRAIESDAGKFAIYLGYAGWAAGQLEGEISRDDWHIFPGDSSIVFDQPVDDIWPALIRRSQAVLVDRRHGPPNAHSSTAP